MNVYSRLLPVYFTHQRTMCIMLIEQNHAKNVYQTHIVQSKMKSIIILKLLLVNSVINSYSRSNRNKFKGHLKHRRHHYHGDRGHRLRYHNSFDEYNDYDNKYDDYDNKYDDYDNKNYGYDEHTPDPEGWIRNFRKMHDQPKPELEQQLHANISGRGMLSELAKMSKNIASSFSRGDAVGVVRNLFGGAMNVASEVGGIAGGLISVVQTGITNIVANELNDLNEPETRDIRLLLYTQKNIEEPQVLNREGDIDDTNFDKTKGIKMLIYGFTPSASPIFDIFGNQMSVSNITKVILGVLTIKNSYLEKKSEDNIIVVDWIAASGTIIYPSAASATRGVGKVVSTFLLNLHEKGNLDPDKTHIIGFSLGGQMSGTIGRLFHEESGTKLGRITGLDPAGPGFDLIVSKMIGSDKAPDDERFILDKGDAKFVDIIHTNGQLGGLGTVSNTGHANFFPNGGATQPNCSSVSKVADAVAGCSHERAWQLYAESVASKKFPACKCASLSAFEKGICECKTDDAIYMGDLCSVKARGLFYLEALLGGQYDGGYVENMEREAEMSFKRVRTKENLQETTTEVENLQETTTEVENLQETTTEAIS